MAANGVTDRRVWIADSVEGLPVPSLPQDEGYDLSKAKMPNLAISHEEIQHTICVYDLLAEQIRFLKGTFHDTPATAPADRFALLRRDGDLCVSTMDASQAMDCNVQATEFILRYENG